MPINNNFFRVGSPAVVGFWSGKIHAYLTASWFATWLASHSLGDLAFTIAPQDHYANELIVADYQSNYGSLISSAFVFRVVIRSGSTVIRDTEYSIAPDAAFKYSISFGASNRAYAIDFYPLSNPFVATPVYNISTSCSPGGSITSSSEVQKGSDFVVSITPDFGFHIGDVLVDGVSVGAFAVYTFSYVQEDHTISAVFIPNAATHFVARWEFAQELPCGGWYRESDITPLSVGSIASTSYFGSNTLYADILRIRFCDSAGNLQKFSGNISGLNSVNGNGEEDQNSQTFVTPDLVDSTSVILLHNAIASGADFVGGEGYKFNLVIGGLTSELVEEHSPEGEIEPEVLPKPVLPEPDDIIEPEPVIPPDEPSAPFPPIIPFPPEQPQTGCECEIYSSQLISRAIDSLSAYLRNDMYTLNQRLKWLGNYLPLLFETLTKVSVDATNAQIQISKYLAERDAMLFDRFEILFKRALMSDSTEQAKGLTESLRESLIDSDGIGFADKFQPVVIENEFRTQSHRLVDDIDTTINI